MKGDASLSTRKGNKRVAVYDLTLTLSWEGYAAGEETSVKGEWKLAEFASANDEDEYIVTVTTEGGKGGAHEVHRKHAATLQPQIIRALHAIAAQMIEQ